jgi:hypothetical protein
MATLLKPNDRVHCKDTSAAVIQLTVGVNTSNACLELQKLTEILSSRCTTAPVGTIITSASSSYTVISVE